MSKGSEVIIGVPLSLGICVVLIAATIFHADTTTSIGAGAIAAALALIGMVALG